jgi:DNA polymerase-3 subunit epsilon
VIPGLDFVAIDFELANPKHSSICQIGLVKVRDGVLGKTHTHYVMPPVGHQHFGDRQIAVHHITRRMIDGADSWDLPLVAHNVTAERSMIRQTSEAAGLVPPDFTYYCTQRAAQLHIPEQGPFRLNVLVERLGLPPLQHHDAGEDAAAAAHLAVRLAEITGITDVHELFPAMKPSPAAKKKWKK